MKTKVIIISLLSLLSTLAMAENTPSNERDKLCINSRLWKRITEHNKAPSVLQCEDKFICTIVVNKTPEKQSNDISSNNTVTVTISEKDTNGKPITKANYTCDKKSDLDENDPSICSTGVEEKMTCAYHFEKYYESTDIG